MSLLTLLKAPQGVTRRGVLAYYDFHEGSGDTLQDLSGKGNEVFLGASSGTDAADPTWGAGYVDFDGTDDLINLPHFTQFDGNQALTMQWVVTVTTTTASLWGYGDTVTGSTSVLGIKITGGFLQAFNYAGNTVTSASAVMSLNDSGVITLVRDPAGSSNTVIYLNDTQVAAGDIPDATLTYGAHTLGAEAGIGFSASRLYTCLCYATALTPGEIRNNYHALKTRLAPRGVSL